MSVRMNAREVAETLIKPWPFNSRFGVGVGVGLGVAVDVTVGPVLLIDEISAELSARLKIST